MAPVAPLELVDLEVTSALQGLLRDGKVDDRRAELALTDLRRILLHTAHRIGDW